MTVADEIHSKLASAFSPTTLEVIDESEQHRGHAGYQEGGQSHFRVRISSEAVGGATRIARHRAVHGAIGPELIGRIHALAIEMV